jgi:hypothetical protein
MCSTIETGNNKQNDATLLAQELADKELRAAGVPLDSQAAEAFRGNVRMFGIMGVQSFDSRSNTK